MIRIQNRRTTRCYFAVLLALLMAGSVQNRGVNAAESPAVDAQAFQRSLDRAVAFLKTQQAPDGSYASFAGPGVTAVVATGLLQNGISPDDPLVARSLDYLEGFVQNDGGVYQAGSLYRNYETSLAILCFSAANRDGRYGELIDRADDFLKGIQWDQQEGKDRSDPAYGGAGYGKHKRPDLSNTSFLIDALRAAGNGPDDPAIQKALVFVSRCQNLESAHNTTPFASKNPDGGFYYTPAAGGQSQAGETPTGGLRSYGSMTYAGLKSMIYAGVGPDDPRVQAAMRWIEKTYDLGKNPGMGDAGLYYYYHTFAKALAAIGEDTITGPDGQEHHWRQELLAELLRRQRDNGGWLNDNPRWLEAEPSLVTGYVLMTMAYLRPATED